MAGSSIPLSFLFLMLYTFSAPVTARMHTNGGDRGFVSAVVTEKGLRFVKDLLVELAARTLTPLRLRDVEKSVRIPVIGRVHVGLMNITIDHIQAGSSTIHPGKSGVLIVASGAAANLSMDWYYSYSTWLVPIEISDRGKAFIQVKGMEIGLTVSLENQKGNLKLTMRDCGCYMEDILIVVEGGASWFYQGLVDAFEDRIRSAIEAAVKRKITKGISKIDSLLWNMPMEIRVDDIVSVNVSLVDDPLLRNSSIEFDIDGLFFARNKVLVSSFLHKKSKPSLSCKGPSKMLGISLDEAVFNSASVIYFEAGQLCWTVDKVPDQSLLNTAGWRFIVPQLYKKYPNDDMKLNISVTSPPVIRISKQNMVASISSDMIVDVLDGNEMISVACISMVSIMWIASQSVIFGPIQNLNHSSLIHCDLYVLVVTASGVPEISGNNFAGRLSLQDFTLNLKWSKVGVFRMNLIQGVMRVFLNNVFIPYVNSHLRKGFPLPIIHGVTLKNATILYCDSRIIVCTDLTFRYSHEVMRYPLTNVAAFL